MLILPVKVSIRIARASKIVLERLTDRPGIVSTCRSRSDFKGTDDEKEGKQGHDIAVQEIDHGEDSKKQKAREELGWVDDIRAAL